MYSLHFTLKQHTPLIHFQHDQDGAIMGASEMNQNRNYIFTTKL